MIYLRRGDELSTDIEALEDESKIGRLLAKGYKRIKPSEYRAARRLKDKRAVPETPQERSVGDVSYVPSGFKLFHVKKAS
jgi:hypothetical protein